jgi:hypothetical protein
MSFNNFKSTTIRGSFNNSDHADGSILASATFQRGLTSSALITTNGLLNSNYNSIFGNNSFNVLQSQSGGYFYSGSFSQIPIVNLPLNPTVGTTYTFYNAGTFTVLIQCPLGNGFESAGQIVQNGLSPPACILFQGSNITLYFRGSWVCVAGFSYMPARLQLSNTFAALQTFNNININGVLNLPNNSILDGYLSSNVVIKNTNNTFTQVNRFNSISHFNASVVFGPISGVAKMNIDSFSGNVTTDGEISCSRLIAPQLSFSNNSILDGYLSSNVVIKNTNNTFTQINRFNSTSHFNASVIFGPIAGTAKMNIDAFSGNVTTDGEISCSRISAAQLSFSNNSILDTYLSPNVVLSSDLNALLSSYNYLTTGDQNITGVKTFLNTIIASENVSCGSSVITQDNIASPFIIATIVRSRFTSFITREKNEHPSINQLGFRQYVSEYYLNVFSPVNQYTTEITVPPGLHLFSISQVIINTSTTTATTITSRTLALTTFNSPALLFSYPMYTNNTFNTTLIPIGKSLMISTTYTIYEDESKTYYLGSSCVGSGGVTNQELFFQSTRIG